MWRRTWWWHGLRSSGCGPAVSATSCADQGPAQAEIELGDPPARAAAVLDPVVVYFEPAIPAPAPRASPAGEDPPCARPGCGSRSGPAPGRRAAGQAERGDEQRDEPATLLDGSAKPSTGSSCRASWRADPLRRWPSCSEARVLLQAGRRRRPVETPLGQVGVVYALIGDTLLTWTVVDTLVRLRRTRVDRAELVGAIDDVRASLGCAPTKPRPASGSRRCSTGWSGRSSHSWVRARRRWWWSPTARSPASRSPPSTTGRAGATCGRPPAALRRKPRRRGGPPRRAPGGGSVVLIADPAFAPGEFPGLERLPGAAAEVAAIAAQDPGAEVVDGPAADRRALERALRGGGVVHYAGHAVFDDQRRSGRTSCSPLRTTVTRAGSLPGTWSG